MQDLTFGKARALLSHKIIRNDILNRLSNVEVWGDTRLTIPDLVESLVDHWPETMLRPGNLAEAKSAWFGRTGESNGARELLKKLTAGARSLPHVQPHNLFPSDEEIGRWMNDVDKVATHLDKPGYSYNRGDLRDFWYGILSIAKLAAAMDDQSSLFWDYFCFRKCNNPGN